MGEFPIAGGVPRTCVAGHGGRERRRRRAGLDHDAARRQGARIRAWCSCPAGRRACFPISARSTKTGRPGSRRSAGSPMSASPAPAGAAKIYFAANRRVRGLWQSSPPSRFIDELPEDHVEVGRGRRAAASAAMASARFEREPAFASRYDTPGWRRARENAERGEAASAVQADRSARGLARRRRAGLRRRRAGVPPQIRPGQRRRGRRREADGRFRPRRPQDWCSTVSSARRGESPHAAFDFGVTSAV